jgi:hypothetical protein
MRSNRREQLNEYHRNRRASIRAAKERATNKSVDPRVFLTNKTLLRTVANWIVSTGGVYARNQLDKTGVSSDGIDQIIQVALKEISKGSF